MSDAGTVDPPPAYDSSREQIEEFAADALSALAKHLDDHGPPSEWAIRSAMTNSHPERLRGWALGLLAEARDGQATDELCQVYDMPDYIRNLHPEGGSPMVFVHGPTQAADAYVQLCWGGGLVKYGLLIGADAFAAPPEYSAREWVPGIYGWQTQ